MELIHDWRCHAASRWLRSVVVSRKAPVSRGQLSPSAGSTDTQSARRMILRSPRRPGPADLSPAGPKPPSRMSQLSSRATPDGPPAYSRAHTFRQDFCGRRGLGKTPLGGRFFLPLGSAQGTQQLLLSTQIPLCLPQVFGVPGKEALPGLSQAGGKVCVWGQSALGSNPTCPFL